jgi:Fe-Mn family superoxide dismutase
MTIKLPRLPYELDALEPVISATTLRLHHGTHHRGYVKKVNALIKGTDLERESLDAIVRRTAPVAATDPASASIFNNAAQAWNHSFYWNSLRPANHGGGPLRELSRCLTEDLGGLGPFAEAFRAAALGVFGSGWVWLIVDNGALRICATSNADTPIAHGQVPLLVMDVWEHAYYLDHQARRDLYAAGVVDQLLNWDFAERNYLSWAGAGGAARNQADGSPQRRPSLQYR